MLTRRSVGALLSWGGVVATAALVLLVASSGASGQDQEPDVADLARGAEVYAMQCAICHGPDGSGRQEPVGDRDEVTAGPPVRGLELAYVDQQMRTGRMPIVDPHVGVSSPEVLTDEDREATLAWMREEMDLVGEIPELLEGDRTRGHELYAIHCAACHGSLGDGGIGSGGTVILGVLGHDRLAQVEAIRVGPYDMPAFDEAQLSVQDASDIAEFVVTDLDGAPRTPLGLREMHRYTMWGTAALLALALLGTVALLGRRVRYPSEDGG